MVVHKSTLNFNFNFKSISENQMVSLCFLLFTAMW